MTELQMVFKTQGRAQKVTGRFGNQTLRNVLNFQREHGIEQTGNVATKTRKALRASSEPAQEVPSVPLSSVSKGRCTTQQCDFHVSRTTTHRYADWVTRHPVTTSAVSTAILGTVCKVFKLNIAALACQVFADVHIERLKVALVAAARENACLRITITRNALRPRLTFDTDDSTRCKR